MHEILASLSRDAVVVDLGCARGSFSANSTHARVIRIDWEMERSDGGHAVRADAALLPLLDRSVDAIVANHSLEHFDDLQACLLEIGRVLHPGGALFVSVPDASTLTDKLYRWLARGGGHVNPFTKPNEVIRQIEAATGMVHVATRTLYSSLSYLNRHNSPCAGPRRLLLVGGGSESSLLLYTWLSRRIDRTLNLRSSIYGWAFYFGNISVPISPEPAPNVCIRCGSGATVAELTTGGKLRRTWFGLHLYTCLNCGARNSFSDDPA